MLHSRRFYNIILAAGIISWSLAPALAAEDGFEASGGVKSKFFDIYYTHQVDLPGLARNLGVGASDKFLAGKTLIGDFSSQDQLGDTLDTLYLKVSDMLDMKVQDYRCKIKICRDYAQLNTIYRDFFGKDLGTRSFYSYSFNTIYTSVDNFKLGIVGHEIAHAIISHYFVVLPSVKIQEVLAMYVDYQLRSSSFE